MRTTTRRPTLARLFAAAAATAAGLLAPAAAHAATPQEVDAAIKKAVEYLYSQRQANNTWELVNEFPKGEKQQYQVKGWQWGGVTGTAVYGLLAAGEKPVSPKLRPSIDWLKTADIHGHYASAMRAQTWPHLTEKEAKTASKVDFQLLGNGLIIDAKDPKRTGFYSYYTDEKGKPQDVWYDRSVGQICVLGMWACEEAGQEVPNKYWEIVDAAWKKAQKPDGGWNYKDDGNHANVSGTMTAAGIATLFITQDHLNAQQQWSLCKGGSRNEWIERGLGWMDKNAPKLLLDAPHYYYQMYGIERIGVASGRKYFGTTDWYKVGADQLVKKQNKNGSWGNAGDEGHNPRGVPDTVFSILFLTRGRAPVVMNKLEYEIAGADPKKNPAANDPWNQRPRDVANFTNWAAKKSEQFLNWQVVNLKVPSAELHDAPILYLSGSLPLKFTEEEESKLRQFVEDGGIILGNADCGREPFSKSFIELGNKLFPKYEFREVPKTHVLFDQVYKPNRWKSVPKLLGKSNEARELMILIPDSDLGRIWQTRADGTRGEAFELMFNVFMYAIDKAGLRSRGDSYVVLPDAAKKPARTITVARVMAGDNADPEPGGWRRLAAVLHNTASLGVRTEAVKLGDGSLDPKKHKLAHWTGTTKLGLSDAARADLKKYVDGGGTLLVDAAGGSGQFADAVEAELAKTFGGNPKELGVVLPPDHPLYAAGKVERVGYRQYAQTRISGKMNAPHLRAILVEGRPAVIYSREDLSVGLVGQNVDGVIGYTPESATEVAKAVVLFAAGKAPAGPVARADEGEKKPAEPAKPTPGSPTKPKAPAPKKK